MVGLLNGSLVCTHGLNHRLMLLIGVLQLVSRLLQLYLQKFELLLLDSSFLVPLVEL